MDIDTLVFKYGDEFMDIVWKDLPDSQYGNLESIYLYAYMREYKPRCVFELGTAINGRSSFIIHKAIEENGGGLHTMCDLPHVGEEALANLSKHFPVYNVWLLSGPIEQMAVHVDMSKIDFLFIDADHGEPFAEWYMDNFIPRLNDGVVIHIHDMPRSLYGNFYPKDFPNEFVSVMKRLGSGTVQMEEICFLDDWKKDPKLKKKHDDLNKKYPIIGKFGAKDLPYSSSAAYFKKIAGGR